MLMITQQLFMRSMSKIIKKYEIYKWREVINIAPLLRLLMSPTYDELIDIPDDIRWQLKHNLNVIIKED